MIKLAIKSSESFARAVMSAAFIVMAIIAIGLSVWIWVYNKGADAPSAERLAIFIGLWAPSFISLAVYSRGGCNCGVKGEAGGGVRSYKVGVRSDGVISTGSDGGAGSGVISGSGAVNGTPGSNGGTQGNQATGVGTISTSALPQN